MPKTSSTSKSRNKSASASTRAAAPIAASAPARRPETEGIRSVSLISLGCPKNLVDSEKMLGMLAESGLAPISYDPAKGGFGGADAVVVNTCGFLEASKDESLSVIKEAIAAKETGEVKRVIVAGCLVQRHRAKMLEWAPGIDAMVGVFDRDKIVEAVGGPGGAAGGAGKTKRAKSLGEASDSPKYWIAANALQAAKARGVDTVGLTVNGKDGKGIGYFEDDSARLRLTPRHYAYLRVSEGCNQNCAFCTIPSIRGKMRSKPVDRLVTETKELLADGAFELLLIGQDTTSYGDDIGVGLAGRTIGGASGSERGSSKGKVQLAGAGLPLMLKTISDTMEKEGVKGWLRLMYAYPSNFSRECIDAFVELTQNGRLLKYLDIPLQHASGRVLKLMRRNVEAAQQEELIETLRERVPGMAIRTTFISGFPGETEEDHEELLSFVDRMQFDAVGVFEYSQEPGTVAGTMEDDPELAVAPEVKLRRRDEIMALQQKIAFEQAAFLAEQFDEKNPMDKRGRVAGAQFDVIIDEAKRASNMKTSGVTDGGRLYAGRAYFQAPQIDSVTYVQSRETLSPGELVRCVVVASDGYDLIARPVVEIESGGKRVGLKILNR